MRIRSTTTAAAAAGVALLAAGTVGAGPAHVRTRPVAAVAAQASTGPAPAGGPRIGVVLNALDNPFFVAIYEGVRAEQRRRGAEVTVRSVTSNAVVAGQARQLRIAAAARPDCFVVNPITATNLVAPLRGVRGTVVDVDSPIDPVAARRAGVAVDTYIGTDDHAAGRLAGRRMAALLRGRGEVALVGGLATNVNSGRRLRGFVAGLRGSSVRVVARVDADYDRAKAEIAAGRILRAHPGVDGFFAASDLMALGVADALRAGGRAAEVRIVGLDGIAEALDAVQDGVLSATVSQYPYMMGQMAVEACAAAARGARLPAQAHAPIALITRENVGRAIRAFPRPFRPYADPFRRLLRP